MCFLSLSEVGDILFFCLLDSEKPNCTRVIMKADIDMRRTGVWKLIYILSIGQRMLTKVYYISPAMARFNCIAKDSQLWPMEPVSFYSLGLIRSIINIIRQNRCRILSHNIGPNVSISEHHGALIPEPLRHHCRATAAKARDQRSFMRKYSSYYLLSPTTLSCADLFKQFWSRGSSSTLTRNLPHDAQPQQ